MRCSRSGCSIFEVLSFEAPLPFGDAVLSLGSLNLAAPRYETRPIHLVDASGPWYS